MPPVMPIRLKYHGGTSTSMYTELFLEYIQGNDKCV